MGSRAVRRAERQDRWPRLVEDILASGVKYLHLGRRPRHRSIQQDIRLSFAEVKHLVVNLRKTIITGGIENHLSIDTLKNMH